MEQEEVISVEPPKRQKKASTKEDTAADAEEGGEVATKAAAVLEAEAPTAPREAKKKKKKKKQAEEAAAAPAPAGEEPANADLFASVAADFAAAATAKAAAKEAKAKTKAAGSKAVSTAAATAETAESAKCAGSVVAEQAVEPVKDMSAWADFGLDERLLGKLAAAGFAAPRPIQREVMPAAIHGRRDVCGAAETGSGKTLAFGLPILQRLLELEDVGTPPEGLFALIIAPTRELASQVAGHLRAVAPDCIRVVNLVGGLSIDKQKRLLNQKPQVAVATPGRLWELMQDHTVPHLRSLDSVRFFVLDEVRPCAPNWHEHGHELAVWMLPHELVRPSLLPAVTASLGTSPHPTSGSALTPPPTPPSNVFGRWIGWSKLATTRSSSRCSSASR